MGFRVFTKIERAYSLGPLQRLSRGVGWGLRACTNMKGGQGLCMRLATVNKRLDSDADLGFCGQRNRAESFQLFSVGFSGLSV